MRALRYHGRRDFRLEDIDEPSPGIREVKVRVEYCGICGSDLHEYLAGLNAVPVGRPHPQTGKMAPIVGGHEFSGVVCELGSGVVGFGVGDRVAVRPTLPCYRCKYCREGRLSQCAQLATIGISADGAFADFVVVRQDCLHKMPDGMTFETATYAEPLACGIHAVKRSGMRPGAIVAVIGAGTVGLMALQAALACGAAAVYVFDTVPSRCARALKAGATAVFDPREGDPGKKIASVTQNQRADIAFECAGVPAALTLAESVTGRGATILAMGLITESFSFSLLNLLLREKSIVTCMGYDNSDYEAALALLASGRVKGDPLLTTAKIGLSDILTGGFEALIGPDRLEHCKILVSPEAG